MNVDLIEAIDQLLPQTQCTRCGFNGCRPYAEAIATQQAEINQCPPGGAATIQQLAALLQRPSLPLNPLNGTEKVSYVAHVDERRCIGCAKCLPPCPVDAIVGARRQMHTVLDAWCTGCELCIAPCPVDCIEMIPRGSLLHAVPAPTAAENRQRYTAHVTRLQHLAQTQAAVLDQHKLDAGSHF
jgi:Na+-translocating ferredoxin:NAD+ oxidoreductase subunit B